MMQEEAVPNIDINPNDWVEIRRILRTCVPEYEVWAFGSRAKWTAKPYSDLDLAIVTDKPLSLEKAAELSSALDESTIPIKVDVVDWAATSESFRKIIEAGKVVVLRPERGLSGWAFKRLIDCTVDGVLSYGIVQPGQHDERGVPIVRVNNISTGQLHVEEPLRVAPEIEANYQRTRLQGGEVLLTVVGTTGQSAIVPKELAGWNVARAVAVIRPKPEIGARWIHICLQSKAVQQFLDERANTTVQKTLNLSDIKEVLIPIPPLGVKEVIESIAVGLDDKIELNRRMNATLDAMAQALFQSWFVDFDPVRAKLDNRQPAGMDQATAALFPATFQESTVGHIPSGWKAGKLCDFMEVGIGGTWGEGAPSAKQAVSVSCLRGIDCHELAERRLPDIPTRYLSEEQWRNRTLSEGCILIEGSGSFCGRSVAWLKEFDRLIGKPVSYSNFCKRLNPRGSPSQALICWMQLRSAYDSGVLGNFRTGTAFPNLDIHGALLGLDVVCPPKEVCDRYLELYRSWLRTDLIKESRALSSLRDTLLPKLLSGQLSVSKLRSHRELNA